MSYTEFNTGKLYEIPIINDDIEYTAEVILNILEKGILDNSSETYIQQLLCNYDFILVKNRLFQISERIRSESGNSFCKINRKNNNNFEYISEFYSGETCLSEMLEDELRVMIEKGEL